MLGSDPPSTYHSDGRFLFVIPATELPMSSRRIHGHKGRRKARKTFQLRGLAAFFRKRQASDALSYLCVDQLPHMVRKEVQKIGKADLDIAHSG